MQKRLILLLAVLALVFSISALSQTKAPAVDRAYLQKIQDTWGTFDMEKIGQYYVQGPGHFFFDITPLKYTGWDQYKAGVQPLLKQYSSFTMTINDDLQIHPEGGITWVDSTINVDATTTQGQKQNMVLRWTAILEQQGRALADCPRACLSADGAAEIDGLPGKMTIVFNRGTVNYPCSFLVSNSLTSAGLACPLDAFMT